MTPDLFLNLTWTAIALSAFAALFISEFGRTEGSRSPRVRRALALLFVALALFPCVSASDDLLSLSLLQSKPGHLTPSGSAPEEDTHLLRVLQLADHIQLAGFCVIVFIACLLALITVAARRWITLLPVCFGGRAPPCPA